jgi:uncharacterized membrane protein YozB (DUF420 family)
MEALDELVARARRLAQPTWVRQLPSLNASLNALCSVFLVAGWLLIRRRPAFAAQSARRGSQTELPDRITNQPAVRAHITCMLLAVATSMLFLASYLVYHYQAGGTPFRGTGLSRSVYFTILISHTVLATVGVVPLVFLTVLRALRSDFARHVQVAQTALPIWLYVSVTGVVIYLMLYHVPMSASSAFP